MIKIQIFSMLCLTSTMVICKSIPVQVIKRRSTNIEPNLVGHHFPYCLGEGKSLAHTIPFKEREIYSPFNLLSKYFLNEHTVQQLPVKYNHLKTVRKSLAKVTLLSSPFQSYQLYPVHHVITEFIPILRVGNNINEKRKLFANELISNGQYDLNTVSSNEDRFAGDINGRLGSIEQNSLESESDSNESNILDEVTILHPDIKEIEYTPVATSYVEDGSRLNDENILEQKFDVNESDTSPKTAGNKLSNKEDLEKYIYELIYGLSKKKSNKEREDTSAEKDDSIDVGVVASKRLDSFGQTDIYGGEGIYEGTGTQVGAVVEGETGTTVTGTTDEEAVIDGVIDVNGETGINDGIDIGEKTSLKVKGGVFVGTDIQEEADVKSETGASTIASNDVRQEDYASAGINEEKNISEQGDLQSDFGSSAETSERMNISEDTNDFRLVNANAEFQEDANNIEGVGIFGATNVSENISKDVNISEEDHSIRSGSEIDEEVAVGGRTLKINNEAEIEKIVSKDEEVPVESEEADEKDQISKDVSHLTGDDIINSKDAVHDGDASIMLEKNIDGEANSGKMALNSEDAHIENEVFFGEPKNIYRDSDHEELTGIYSEVDESDGTSISDETGTIHGSAGAKEEIDVDEETDTDDDINNDVGQNIRQGSIIVGKARSSHGGTDVSTHTTKNTKVGKGLVKIYKTVYVYHH